MQSRKLSLIEAMANVAAGFAISLISQIYIFEQYGVSLPLAHNLAISCWFTLISIVRSYALRRAFNRIHGHEPAEQYTRLVPVAHRVPPIPPPPPPPRMVTACGRTLSDEEVRRIRAAAAGMQGPSL